MHHFGNLLGVASSQNLPHLEDEEEYGEEQYEGDLSSENDQLGNMKENEILSKEEKTR